MRWGAVTVACCLLPVASAHAQSLLLPNDVPTFEYPLASSRASAMVGRVIYLSRGESRFGAEWEGEAGLGEVWPLLALGRGGAPLTLHLGTEVYGRFSLGDAASAMISNDWQVTLVLTAEVARWRLGLEAYHESSHLGDEYHDRFPGPRVNWSREIVGLWAQRNIGLVKMSLNASYAAIQALDLGPGAVALGLDYLGKPGSVIGGGNARAVLALHADAQEYTDWEVTLAGRAGIRFSDPTRRRGFALLLTFLDGMSPQRQFFLQKSRYYGMEVRFDL
jgi:hypothetical protein